MILDEIVKAKKKRLPEHKAKISEAKMKELALASTRTPVSFYDALAKPGLSIIGEFKQASPSAGKIKNELPLAERIAHYNESVDAISCLTEEDHFKGDIGYLKAIRELSQLPIIRKDFIIEEYQIYEAKVIGADAILLITAILTDEELKHFYELAGSLGLDVLVEVHDEEEMRRALQIGPQIIGVNNRNLKDFTISLETTRRLRPMAGEDVVFVSESGIREDEHIAYLKKSGVDAFLIGQSLMEADSPKALAKNWKDIYERTSDED